MVVRCVTRAFTFFILYIYIYIFLIAKRFMNIKKMKYLLLSDTHYTIANLMVIVYEVSIGFCKWPVHLLSSAYTASMFVSFCL